jgi:hypothetical protein
LLSGWRGSNLLAGISFLGIAGLEHEVSVFFLFLPRFSWRW